VSIGRGLPRQSWRRSRSVTSLTPPPRDAARAGSEKKEVMPMATSNHPPRTLVERILDLLHPGPLDWILGLTPEKTRFRPGAHLHGLADHDILVEEPRRR
jgi:hypothetical protein